MHYCSMCHCFYIFAVGDQQTWLIAPTQLKYVLDQCIECTVYMYVCILCINGPPFYIPRLHNAFYRICRTHKHELWLGIQVEMKNGQNLKQDISSTYIAFINGQSPIHMSSIHQLQYTHVLEQSINVCVHSMEWHTIKGILDCITRSIECMYYVHV